MEHTATDTHSKGTLKGWLLSYNLGTIAIIFAVNILLFGLLFSMLSQMVGRNSRYEAVISLSSELNNSRATFTALALEDDSEEVEQLLLQFKEQKETILQTLDQLAVEYERDPIRYHLQKGIANGITYIHNNLDELKRLRSDENQQEFFNLFYATDKVFTYLQEYTIGQYLPRLVRSDVTWILTTRTRILRYRNIAMLLFLFLVLTYTIVTYEMTMRLVRPVSSMVDIAREIEHGQFEGTPIPWSGPKELQYLAQSMEQMRDSLKERIEMIEENSRLEKTIHKQEIERIRTTRELEKARYNALQAQINPHFLFNTLNVISRTALFEGADTTVDLIDSLASIFRYTLEYHDDVSLKEELHFVSEYLAIQQYRFKERLRYSIVCPEELEDLRLPPFVIQPFVENAMIHGLEPMIEGGEISIVIKKENKRAIMTITDTGVGIDLEKFELALKQKKQHIGIQNIIGRLDLYFNGKSRVDLQKVNESGGTQVTLDLPIKRR